MNKMAQKKIFLEHIIVMEKFGLTEVDLPEDLARRSRTLVKMIATFEDNQNKAEFSDIEWMSRALGVEIKKWRSITSEDKNALSGDVPITASDPNLSQFQVPTKLEDAIKLLKEHGYRVLKPHTKWKEV